jgi:hypothetical protein
MTNATMSYPAKIALRFAAIEMAILQQIQANKEDMGEYVHIPLGELATDLGCRSGLPNDLRVSTPPQPKPEDEDLVVTSLISALRTSVDRYCDDTDKESIIDGLLRNDRWRACLNTPEDAYCLAQVLIMFFHNMDLEEGYLTFRASMAEGVRDAVSQWIRPRELPAKMSAMEMARLLFGVAWCELRLESNATKWEINPIIRSDRPPFMPGLLAAHLEADVLPLPTMSL